MMQEFIYFYLTWYFGMCILYKDNFLPNKIEDAGIKLDSELIKELSTCMFCMDWWCSLAFCSSVAGYYNDTNYLFWAVLFTALSAHVRQ